MAMASETTNTRTVLLLYRIVIPLLGLLVSLSKPPGGVKTSSEHQCH